MKLVFAILAAASVPSLMMSAFVLLDRLTNLSLSITDSYMWFGVFVTFILCLIFTAGYVSLVGVPAYAFLRRFGYFNWQPFAIAGAFLGTIPAAVMTWPLKYPHFTPSAARWMEFTIGIVLCAVGGAVAAQAFRLIAPKKSHDIPPAVISE
ncbi:hypothetical protein [Allohahella sp. A8]|uniref:hypothetical protein n=1 Tax=Allohahella sp. A8 TaxID=3141461 RepID=UPI003A8117D3